MKTSKSPCLAGFGGGGVKLSHCTGFTHITSSLEEQNILGALNPEYQKYNEMAPYERAFLNSLILRKKPKKVLELGVSAGGSSVVILNAIKDMPDTKLYSVDYLAHWYKDSNKKVGFIVDEYPDLKTDWTLYTGGLVSEFIDEIGGAIDFCFIDTAHSNPGEILDFLIILPYLTQDCTIVFHDVALHSIYRNPNEITNCLLMSTITGEKLTAPIPHGQMFSNIGGVTLNSDTRSNIWDIFNLLCLNWSYMPQGKDIDSARNIMERFYEPNLMEFFDKIVYYQRKFGFVLPRKKINKWNYLRYTFLSKITLGKTRKRYKARAKQIGRCLSVKVF
jgi:predicted O-methyltransferase YrrM